MMNDLVRVFSDQKVKGFTSLKIMTIDEDA